MEVLSPQSRSFDRMVVVGAAAKEILRSLLERCGYRIYPFGYESSLATLKVHMRDKNFVDSAIIHRIRSMPDFLVASDEDLKLVEVKFRKSIIGDDGQVGIFLKNSDISKYREYWGESHVVLLSPHGERFFSLPVREMVPGTKESKWFNLTSFIPLQKLFPKTDGKTEAFYTAIDKLTGLWD